MGNLTEENMVKAFLHLVKTEKERRPGWGVQVPRICGYLEACLQNFGVLSSKEDLPLKVIKKYKEFIFFGREVEVYENLPQLMVRLCNEYFEKNNIKLEDYASDGQK